MADYVYKNLRRRNVEKSQRIENKNLTINHGINEPGLEKIQNLYKSIRGRLCSVILIRGIAMKYLPLYSYAKLYTCCYEYIHPNCCIVIILLFLIIKT